MTKRKISNEVFKRLIEDYNIKSTDDIKDMLKDLLGGTIQTMLEAEIEDNLGYSKHNYKEKITNNSRNGHSNKTVRSEYGTIDLDIPRDRNGEFEPQIIPKHQREITGIEGQILSLYSKGMSNRDIEDHLQNLYGVDVSPTMISKITDKILPEIREWQSRQLEDVYPIVFMDAIHYSVRKEGIVVKKAVYISIGINKYGEKEVLGFWVGENESSKFWLNILNELRNRGVQDILIISVDNLKGFSEAIKSTFPLTEIQKCIVHQIRNSTRYISYKELKEFTSDLKKVYNAITLEQAENNLLLFEEKWGKKYMAVVKSWRDNWLELTTYFKYDQSIRKLIYTTNHIENFNRQLRKFTKTKTSYPTDDSLLKSIYLSMKEITKKWTGKIPNWGEIYSQLSIYFEGRI
jgi:transposase-like protein